MGRVALGALAFFAVLLWVGGYMGESGASTACEGWPLCNGGIFPAAEEHEITHMLHRYLAAAFAIPLAWLVLHLWRQRAAQSWAMGVALMVVALYGAQVMVGAFNVWYEFPDALTISHTAIAATLWLAISVTAALALYFPVRHEVEVGSDTRAVTA